MSKSVKKAGAKSAKVESNARIIGPVRSVKAVSEVYTTSKDPRAFGLRVSGDAMAPEFPEGCTVIFEPGRKPRNGDAVSARLNDGRGGFVYYRRKGRKIVLSNSKGPVVEVAASELRYAYPALETVHDVEAKR